MITNYIAGADAVLLCYDVTSYESFANLEDWYRLVLRTFQGKDLPYIALIGNKSTLVFLLYCDVRRVFMLDVKTIVDDLRHMAAVKNTQHSKFADENSMVAFLMSAKNGDQVKHCFWKIAATLGNVPFYRFEQESQAVVIPATIIDHQQHDETVNEGQVPEYTAPAKSTCVVN